MFVNDDNIKLARKCVFLTCLEKDEVGMASPTPVRAVGYMNPTTDQKVFGDPASTITEGYRNPLYSKKKKKKEKHFMKAHGFVGNIEELTTNNENFRRVIYTGKHSQLVLMKLLPGEEIGEEVHEDVDQFFRVDSGDGIVIIDGKRYKITDGTGIVVPAGAKHNVINTAKNKDLKLYTIYSPPNHIDGTVHQTKTEAEKDDEEFNGQITE